MVTMKYLVRRRRQKQPAAQGAMPSSCTPSTVSFITRTKCHDGTVSPLPLPRDLEDEGMLPELDDDDGVHKAKPFLLRARADTACTEATTVVGDDCGAQESSHGRSSTWDDQDLVTQLAARFGYTDAHDLENLGELRDRLADMDHSVNHPAEVLRHYKDVRGNVDACEERMRHMLAWRIDHDIDELLDEHYHVPQLLQDYDPHTLLQGTDKDGDPIWLDRTGVSDAWAVYQKYGHDAFCKYTLWVRERALRGSFAKQFEAEQGRPVTQCTAIFDMDGLCRRHLQPGLAPMVEEGIRVLQEYYSVSMCKRIIVIRAPTVFRLVWSVIQHFCSDQLKKTIVFASKSQYLKVLDQYIDREVLPPCIYPQGKGRPALGMPQNLAGGIMTAEQMAAPPQDDKHDLVSLSPQSTYETIASSCDDEDDCSLATNVTPPLLATCSVRAKVVCAGYFGGSNGQIITN